MTYFLGEKALGHTNLYFDFVDGDIRKSENEVHLFYWSSGGMLEMRAAVLIPLLLVSACVTVEPPGRPQVDPTSGVSVAISEPIVKSGSFSLPVAISNQTSVAYCYDGLGGASVGLGLENADTGAVLNTESGVISDDFGAAPDQVERRELPPGAVLHTTISRSFPLSGKYFAPNQDIRYRKGDRLAASAGLYYYDCAFSSLRAAGRNARVAQSAKSSPFREP